MSAEKYFSIIVNGSLSSEAEEGNLDPNSGLPSGPTTKIKLQVGGTSIPNFSKVWAYRHLDAAGKPTGELTFLKWGTNLEGKKNEAPKKGELVQIRYLEGVGTLDKIYQDTVLKVGPKTEEEINQTAYIDLNIGINDFNPEAVDPMFVEFLKRHTYCTDNPSRNPNSKEGHYSIYDPKKINGSKIEQMRLDQRANAIVMSAEQDTARMEILAGIFELDPRAQHEVQFNELLEILDGDKKRILDVVDFHKARFQFLLTKLEDGGDLEYTETDVVLTIDHDRKKLNDVELPAKNMKVYLVDNFLDPDIFAIYQAVLEVDKKLVEQLN